MPSQSPPSGIQPGAPKPNAASSPGADGVFRHEGPARIFTSENAAIEAIKEGRVSAGDVMVPRNEVVAVARHTSIDDVHRIVFDASYLVLGLGDVYLGAPVATTADTLAFDQLSARGFWETAPGGLRLPGRWARATGSGVSAIGWTAVATGTSPAATTRRPDQPVSAVASTAPWPARA